jgi:glycerol uptake facilitator protein
MLAKCFGEFMGTLVLILLGDGVVAGVLLKRSKAEGSGRMVITSGWAFAVMAGVFTAIVCGSSYAYLNPALTIGFAVSSGQFAKVAPYIVAQMSGAFVGATLVWLHFLPHFGPRLAHAALPIAGKGPSDWGYAIVPVLGPLLGGSLAGIALRATGI